MQVPRLTVIPIRMVIDNYGYQSAFLWFGVFQGIVLLIAAQALLGPTPGVRLPLANSRSRPAIGA